MRNAGLDEAQAGIKIAGRNINNLRYADDTTLNGRKWRAKDPLDDVMPKSQNLPMTTGEPISNAKARKFLLPSSRWGSHWHRCSGYREGALSFGLHCLYREYSGERVTKRVFRLKDYWLVTIFYRVVCGFLIVFFHFHGKSLLPR